MVNGFLNVYEMYTGRRLNFGFFVVRESWGNTIAKVTGIWGVVEGEEIPGPPPYHKNQGVSADFFHIDYSTGELKFKERGWLPSPGSYSYRSLHRLKTSPDGTVQSN